jgi:hypothetical protein
MLGEELELRYHDITHPVHGVIRSLKFIYSFPLVCNGRHSISAVKWHRRPEMASWVDSLNIGLFDPS